MTAEMKFTVPVGFTLSVPEKSNFYTSVTTDGNTVTVTRDRAEASNTVVGNDFYVEATLEKIVTTHKEAFTFTKTLADFGENAQVKIVFQNDTNYNTRDYSKKLSDITLTGDGTAAIAVVITGIKEGYSVKSVTIE